MGVLEFDGLIWLLGLLVALVILQRWLHREIVSVFLLITRRINIALILFSILFFPGVILHELSHWILAKLLGVPTGRISLIPERLPDGTLRMGYVEAAQVDAFRDSLVGLAPLLAGGAFVAYVGLVPLEIDVLWGSVLSLDGALIWSSLGIVYAQPDFWLWFYLGFVVSSTMLPSASDRQAWRTAILFALLILLIVLIAGAGPWMLETFGGPANRALRAIAAVFGISAVLHLVLLGPIWGLRRLIERLTGMRVG